ncbi:MAG: hypothetical protein JXM74_08535 [Fusobacteriaceae bacterium]|nr:hypothetical protein [Fusobacteriaceae bacterium]MBN2838784.1 hypothetical protein [Fusobacteriaceae bacterium]
MSLLQIKNNKTLSPLQEKEFKLEKDLQNFCEENLSSLLDLTLVKSEFVIENYRFDTLCFDESSKSFVIIEYKRGTNYSVIDQGYAYLGTMLNNKAEFILEYNERLDKNLKRDDVDWSQSKIVFISQSFSKFQKETINFKDLPIELYELKRFENDIISFTEIKGKRISESIKTIAPSGELFEKVNKEIITYTLDYHKTLGSVESLELFEIFKDKVLEMLPDLNMDFKKRYIAFKKDKKNIFDLLIQKSQLKLWLNVKLGELEDPKFLAKNVSNTGHWGNGDYEIVFDNDDNLEYILSLIKEVYKK